MSHVTLSDEGARTSAGGLRLSVVVTTHERPDYLRQSLATIATQSARRTSRAGVLHWSGNRRERAD